MRRWKEGVLNLETLQYEEQSFEMTDEAEIDAERHSYGHWTLLINEDELIVQIDRSETPALWFYYPEHE